MQKPRILDYALALLFVSCATAATKFPQDKFPQRKISVCGMNFLARVATTPDQQHLGYGHYPEPKKHEAMLFVFPEEEPRAFVMRDVPYDLDIAFFSANKKLVSHTTMTGASPLQREEALTPYPSDGPARYVVEMRAGTLKNPKHCTLRLEN